MSKDVGRLRLLYELGCAFAARRELDALVELVVTRCREVLDAEGAAVLLLDHAKHELYFPYVANEDAGVRERLLGLRFPAGQGIAGATLESGKALRVDDVQHDPRFYGAIDESTRLTTRCILAAPLSGQSGALGVLQVVNKHGGTTFSDDDLAFLSALAGGVGVAIENAQLWSELRSSADRLRAQVGVLRRDRARQDRFQDMIGSARAMAEVFRLMQSAATSPIPVLIEGETGTGKELVARSIHAAGPRAEEPFVAVNCAALPEHLLESELFGHKRGAFTGATQDQVGLFEAASGGTILLDEVGELPLPMQAKLLRVLEDGEILPVGDRRARKIDVRVLAATNRNLADELAARRFRDDLYYRVAAFPIRLPTLRERREDVPLLVERFLADAASKHQKRIAGVDPPALERLYAHDWPGNVRELRNELARAVALAVDGERIGLAHLSERLGARATPAPPPAIRFPAGAPPATSSTTDLRVARDAFEASFIAQVLRDHDGNVSHAARAMGISRVALQKKMKEYCLR
jgi:Nif-specific regulatory protein